jgi:glycosyltransferase involved in cell wall biosynthesis
MKIGIDIRLIGKKRTGDETVVFNLVKNFARISTNHKFKLLTDVSDGKTLSEISDSLGIIGNENFEIVSLSTSSRFAWNFWTLPNYLRKNPVDVYHTQYITPFFVSRNVKILTIVHDISFNFFAKFIKFSDLFFLKTLIPMSLRRADKIVGVSQFTRDEIIRYYKISPDKVDYIYNAVSDEFLNGEISSQQKKLVREKYKLPEKYILYIGTLQPRKNIPHLISAFARIKNEISDVKLVICGNLKAHNVDQQIEKSIENYELSADVVLAGFIDEQDKVAVFAGAHVFAFPSMYEGFGIPPLEAISQNVPVICSDIPSLKEIVQSGALFFDLHDVDDLSKKLYDITVNNDLRAELIQSGKARISFFSWEKTALKMLAIYEDMRHN